MFTYPRENTRLVSERFIKTDYQYTEEVTPIEWQLFSEQEVILGYNCQRATGTFRGREWQVRPVEARRAAGPDSQGGGQQRHLRMGGGKPHKAGGMPHLPAQRGCQSGERSGQTPDTQKLKEEHQQDAGGQLEAPILYVRELPDPVLQRREGGHTLDQLGQDMVPPPGAGMIKPTRI